MRVNCLLVTRDPAVQKIVADVFAGIDVRLREDAASSFEIIAKSHFDGFVIDCDEIGRGTDVISEARSSREIINQ